MLRIINSAPLLVATTCFVFVCWRPRYGASFLAVLGTTAKGGEPLQGSKSRTCANRQTRCHSARTWGTRCGDWVKEKRCKPRAILSMSAHEPTSTPQSNHTGKGAAADMDSSMVEEDDDSMFDDYCDILDEFGCAAFEDMLQVKQQGAEDNEEAETARWVRVEAKADETIFDVHTEEDVFARINDAREAQAKYGPADVYGRHWEYKQSSKAFGIENGGRPKLRVLQFNALAEGLSSSPSAKTPFAVAEDLREPQGFGGFTSILEPSIALDFSKRRWRLMEVILGGGIQDFEKGSFDIIAMEEIDRFRGFFAPTLRIFGYQGIFMPKTRAPGVPLGFYSDGCALFWKSDLFGLVSERRLVYRVGTQVMILVTLRHRPSQHYIVVAVTHLKAQKTAQNERIRCMQVDELLEHVNKAVESLTKEGESVAALILGDFNSDPPYEMCGESSVGRVLSESKGGLAFQSAYEIGPPSGDFFTTWKTRGGKTTKRVIDYVFHSVGMKCTATLSVPKESEMEKTKLPGLRFPSDHLMIGAEFDIV
jgi:hypothetical protein